MEIEKEREVVWSRILPEVGQKVVFPILMCPDDCDFSCTLIVAEIENTGNTIKWNKLGVDMTNINIPENFGSSINWFNKVDPYEFEAGEYMDMIAKFKKQFEVDRLNWEERNRKLKRTPKTSKTKHIKSLLRRLF